MMLVNGLEEIADGGIAGGAGPIATRAEGELRRGGSACAIHDTAGTATFALSPREGNPRAW